MIKQEKGVYPFIVYINNTFPKQTEDEEDVTLEVEYEYVPLNGFDLSKETQNTYAKTHMIYPGQRIAFSLYWPEESLVISISNPGKIKEDHYHVWGGPKARCYFYKNNKNITLKEPNNNIEDKESKSQNTDGDDNENLIFLPSPLGKGKDKDKVKVKDKDSGEDEVFYRGGILKVTDTDFPLKLKIEKLIPDPAEDDVTIGPDPPG